MTDKSPAASVPTAPWYALLVGAAALCAASWMVAGPTALLASGLGLCSTAVSLFGTWMAVQWVGKIMRDESPKWQGAVAPMAVMVIKLPVLLGAMSWAIRLGPPAPSWFLGGLALVYSATVWWAVSRH